jgi:hypothetical protein
VTAIEETQNASIKQAGEWEIQQGKAATAWEGTAKDMKAAAEALDKAAGKAEGAASQLGWRIFVVTSMGFLLFMLVLLIGLWLWLTPELRTTKEGNVATTQAQVKGDRTSQAIARQLKAMGCDLYDIGIRDSATGKMMNREWTLQEVVENAAWLKRMNAQGNDIYIRPAESARHGLVLVDDLSSFDLDAMKEEGREPAAVIETSPKNYQAWVKVAANAPAEHRGAIARRLAREYDADPASADSHHYGRLAGFTNQKPKHTTKTGYQPWVLCRASSGQAATTGPRWCRRPGRSLRARSASRSRPAGWRA